MNQHEYVLGCQRYYAENGYEPGNPEDGEWHDCHYPVPKCLGGTETVKLLKQHHAVQGVLQSEEYQRCCIWGWEKAYLDGELLELARKWMGDQRRAAAEASWVNLTAEERSLRISEMSSRAWARLTDEEKAERLARGLLLPVTTEERSERARKGWAKLTPEEKATRLAPSRSATKQMWDSMTPEEKAERLRRGVLSATPEQRSERARKGWEKRRRNEALRRASSESNTDAPGSM
jgi:hypothetical protein